jgi:uncharacterized membrane protein YjdF
VKKLIPVGLFALCYTLAAVALAIRESNAEFVFYIVVMVVLGAAVACVHSRVGLSTAALWCLALWGLLHMAGGLVPVPAAWPIEGRIRVLYSLWIVPERLKYDQVVHAYGFGVTTWVCWQALRAAFPDRARVRPSAGLLVLCAAAGIGFGALNEVVEFVATLRLANTNVGGYTNTGWDLVSNLVGSVAAALAIRLFARRP